jgi:hypothetical protein
MGSKVSMPAAPAAPAPVDPAKSSIDYINAMADPDLQGRIFAAEQQYRPQYTQLELADINTYLMGGGGQQGVLDLTDEATRRANTLASEQLSQQRAADIGDVEALGARASAAFQNANPQLQQAMLQAQGLSQTPGNLLGGLQQALGQQPQYANIGYDPVQAQQVGGGQLGDLLMQKALNTQDLGAVGQTLQGRAAQFAQSTGQLSPDELRTLQQSTRGAYAARGMDMGNMAIGAEGLARLTNERQRMMEDLGIASAINQASQAEIGANRGFQQNVQGSDLARQFSNVGNQLQAGLANQQAGMYTQEANRAFQAQQYQQGIANQGALAQLGLSQLGQDRNYALSLAQMQQGVASDPFQAILGRPSQSQGAGMGQTQFAAGLAGQALGPNLFDPNAGINLGLQNNANAANYGANIYGAQASYAGATNQGRGSMIGGAIGGLGAVAGGALAGKAFAAKTAFLCIPEGEFVDTPDGPRKIETLRAGDEVVGFDGQFTVVVQKHEYHENPLVKRFHRFTFKDGSQLAVCDMHRVQGVRSMEYGVGGMMGGKEIAKVEVFGGVKRSYDLLTLDDGYQMSGVPVNSMIEELADAIVNGV